MDRGAREKWDRIYAGRAIDALPQPSAVLARYRHLLPPRGEALDLACGRGGNALALAAAGLATEAWDISPVALQQLQALARGAGVAVRTRACDLLLEPLPRAHFDVIAVGHYLERELCAAIAAALRPGGLLFYQTFNRALPAGQGPSNPAFTLAENELPQLFPALRPLVHEQWWGAPGPDGEQGVSRLVAVAP